MYELSVQDLFLLYFITGFMGFNDMHISVTMEQDVVLLE